MLTLSNDDDDDDDEGNIMNGTISLDGRYNFRSFSSLVDSGKDKSSIKGDTINGSLVRYDDEIDNDCNDIASRANWVNAPGEIYNHDMTYKRKKIHVVKESNEISKDVITTPV
jgi:hypothetical protein